jgi:hypothetical protein
MVAAVSNFWPLRARFPAYPPTRPPIKVAAIRWFREPSLDEDRDRDRDRDRECRRRRESSCCCRSLRGDHELERILEGAGRPRSRRSLYPVPYSGGGVNTWGCVYGSVLLSDQLRGWTYTCFVSCSCCTWVCFVVTHLYLASIWTSLVNTFLTRVPHISIILMTSIVLSSIRSV